MASIPRSATCLNEAAFTSATHALSTPEKVRKSYERAKAVVLAYDLTMNDILTLSPKFYNIHNDPLTILDGAAMTLMTIQVNLVSGTIARHAVNRPGLVPLLEDLLHYRQHGQFLLTEVGHGLDISSLETTATLLPSGDFVINTPTPAAAKFMPPTVPAGLPTIGIVWAKLLVDGEDRGVRGFVVPLNDGKRMCTGVTCRLLPERGGPNPVNHAITTFNCVRIPPASLLGSLEKPSNARLALSHSVWRVACGTSAFGYLTLSMMKAFATIGTMYSLRRHVGGPGGRVPIMHFRTQQIPILTLTAQIFVMEAFLRWSSELFRDTSIDYRVRHAIAGIAKATIVGHAYPGGFAISERCGAQGLFAHNQIATILDELRGISIAEGDILVLSIKFATELLQRRYAIPPSSNPDSLLARHEASVFAENRDILTAASHHRGDDVNRLILPNCQPFIEAIGHRLAYDAAVTAGVQQCLIDLYVASVVKRDAAWYSENAKFGRREAAELEVKALDAILPQLGALVRDMGVGPWITSKIVSDERWDSFVEQLEVFTGDADGDIIKERDISLVSLWHLGGWSTLELLNTFT